MSKKEFENRGTLNSVELPDEIDRKSWAHGYQVGLYDAVKYGSIWWFLRMKFKNG